MKDELQGVNKSWGKRLLSKGRIAASAARLATRQLVGSASGEVDALIGEKLVKELDQMKGMAMKVGQVLSYLEGVLPDETQAALQKLQRGVKPVVFEKMKEVAESAFGKPLEELFDSFEQKAVASASIGQVYRASFEGQEVAVKIQYPGIWNAIRSDFSILNRVAGLASLATAVDGAAIVKDLQSRFEEECDYDLEAKNQKAFAEAFEGQEKFKIPLVFSERTKKTVLTSEWCDGLDFYTFQKEASSEQKNKAAQDLMTFAYQSFFRFAALNADPHPGNFLFSTNDEPIVFLDFGCVRHFELSFVDVQKRLAEIVISGERDQFRDVAIETGMIPKPKKFDFDVHWEMMRHQYEPYCSDEFTFTIEYIKRGMEFNKPSNPNLRHISIPPEWVWWQRMQFGLHAVLSRLEASGDFRTPFREALASPIQPLAGFFSSD